MIAASVVAAGDDRGGLRLQPRIVSRVLLAAILSLTALRFSAQPPSADQAPYAHDAATVEHGRTLFLQQCAACHTLRDDAIGPPLGGVTTVLSRERLLTWVHNPTAIIGSGDARANGLFRRYKVTMPSFGYLSAGDIASILAFIDHESVEQHLKPFVVDLNAAASPRLVPPVEKTNLVVELEDVVQIPRLPGRTPYKGITLLRPDPRESGALFVDDLMGILYRVEDHRASLFLDVRSVFQEFICDPGVATGLGSFALHPDFVHNGLFYTTHAETFRGSPAINPHDIPADLPPTTSPKLEWVLTEWRLEETTGKTFRGTHREVLRFVAPTTAHNAQEIAFAPRSNPRDPDYAKLYIAIGDGGSANLKRPEIAGHPRTLLGTILRIDPRGKNSENGQYGIPSDNPFAREGDPTIRKEIWAYGFRNPHRISWDLAHPERMIAVDIGESNIEEVNLVERGGAYGWGQRQIEGIAHIDPKIDAKVVRAATAAELAGVHLPFGVYDHFDGSAITGGYVYHGPIAVLRDKYVFADIVSGQLFFMNLGAQHTDHTVYALNVVRDGAATTIRALAHAERAHVRIGYDERTGDLYVLSKDDGMIRRVTKAYTK